MAQILTYNGKALADGDTTLKLDPYTPSPELVQAVNMALIVRNRPLLLMGEPGVGKTCLAESVAYELLHTKGLYKQNFFRWDIKSTSKAKDGLYRYDTFSRLADSQILRDEQRKKLNNLKLGVKGSYIQRGVLAEAFACSTKECPSVLLIDEIDKADIDFPNDLLNELENYEFTIPETGERVTKGNNFAYPVIIITSNRERELPPAFLRRCLYHYITFPDTGALTTIIHKKFGTGVDKQMLDNAIKKFIGKRNEMKDTERRPSTSELLDWFKVLNHFNGLKNDNNDKVLSDTDKELIEHLKFLDDDASDKIPFPQLLLKTYETFVDAG